ncbi:sensor histidine kinase [Paenibacillus piri]|uniref:histidine kinase n=1 Tax=Paenibacillus piri TaxID=2547395 RepID=A0A4R5KCF4_9BACL|nr:sensor histidine kinase [Paenibacillus piri]
MYKNIKSLILIIPTLTIGLWEYVRHTFLLPYISMDLGNWLAPLLVFVVTMTLLRKLFRMLEVLQEMLQQERSDKAALLEREKISRELHDGIAQSLFLLSVKADQMEQGNELAKAPFNSFRKTVHQVNDYVRQAIASLRYPPVSESKPWGESIQNLVIDFRKDTGIAAELNWKLREERLSLKEKVELYATLREALINVYKHANARHAWVSGEEEAAGWKCKVTDDGDGFPAEALDNPGGFGITIMKERAQEMGWFLNFKQEDDGMTVEVGRRE